MVQAAPMQETSKQLLAAGFSPAQPQLLGECGSGLRGYQCRGHRPEGCVDPREAAELGGAPPPGSSRETKPWWLRPLGSSHSGPGVEWWHPPHGGHMKTFHVVRHQSRPHRAHQGGCAVQGVDRSEPLGQRAGTVAVQADGVKGPGGGLSARPRDPTLSWVTTRTNTATDTVQDGRAWPGVHGRVSARTSTVRRTVEHHTARNAGEGRTLATARGTRGGHAR